ncbi:MAG TPA: hypothetical protein VIN93_04650 [Bryobacteraceae bacterium]|jgi:hypothetical protein
MRSLKRLILAYKNFAANRNISHIGLGVAALNTAKVLRANGIAAEVWPITSAVELGSRLDSSVSHVVTSAPWIPAENWQRLTAEHPEITFAVNCHSNVGFLQADANGVRRLRDGMELERGTWNFHVAGNSRKFCDWIRAAYRAPCAYLTNLYYLEPERRPYLRTPFSGGTLRLGAFGATRPLKNLMSAAGAALEIAGRRNAPLEFWVSAGRAEGGLGIMDAVRAMMAGLPHARLVENGWQTWPRFRETVRHMHLLLQPSYTESFNMVTADGVAEGVASVVSDAIDWAPRAWKAGFDHVDEIARVGSHLLADQHAAVEGFQALEAHNAEGLRCWKSYLDAA